MVFSSVVILEQVSSIRPTAIMNPLRAAQTSTSNMRLAVDIKVAQRQSRSCNKHTVVAHALLTSDHLRARELTLQHTTSSSKPLQQEHAPLSVLASPEICASASLIREIAIAIENVSN